MVTTKTTKEAAALAATVAVIHNDIETLKSQHRNIDARIAGLEERLVDLEVADERLAASINSHIQNEDLRWENNERSWRINFKLQYGMGFLLLLIALENFAHIKEFLKLVF